MDQDDIGCIGKNTAFENFSGRYNRLINRSDCDNIHVNHLILGIKIQDSQYFSVKGREFLVAQEELSGKRRQKRQQHGYGDTIEHQYM